MKKIVRIVSVFLCILVLAGCSSAKTATKSSTKATTQKATTLKVKDSNGEVTVPKNPQKVVVFDNSALDTLDALGVGDKVVGAATSSLPEYLKKYATVESAGGIKEPDLEKINQLRPDLIIISGRQSDYLEQLKKIAPTIFLSVDDTKTWPSIKQNVEVLAEIFDKKATAKTKLAELEDKIATTKKKAQASKQKALTVLVNEGQLSAFGEGSRFGIIYDTFGFLPADEHIEASIHGQSVSYEYVLEKDPDILFVIDRTKAIGGDDSQNQVVENELVKQTKAGKESQVISLTPDIWYLSGSGLESVDLMLADVNQALK